MADKNGVVRTTWVNKVLGETVDTTERGSFVTVEVEVLDDDDKAAPIVVLTRDTLIPNFLGTTARLTTDQAREIAAALIEAADRFA
ncbi:hypothetical protein [Williamsia muralis]|uniref:Uncharacterized protein n=1 Tax=Williamsia marianensis TaxID=85044 RepID=A0ABU4EZ85_WILMA|nr:hypothetical protein [Williamsia muralis]MDV7136026.1 hypothetical protein [Williamsia muralis]